MRTWRFRSLEHSSGFTDAVDTQCGLYNGYDPSNIGRFWRSAWSDDCHLHGTITQRGSGRLAGRFTPRCGPGLLDGDGVQCPDDVHRSIVCLSGQRFRRAPGTADVWDRFHDDQRAAAICCKFRDLACIASARGPYGGDILPTHAVYCSPQPAREVCAARLRYVRDGHCLYHKRRDSARSLVHGPLIMALDLLEQRCAYANNDRAHLLWHSSPTLAEAERGTAQTELARVFVCEPRVHAAVYGAQPGAAAELAALRKNHCLGRYGTLSVAGSCPSPFYASSSAGRSQVPHATKHCVAGVGRFPLPHHDDGDPRLAT